MKMGSKKKKVKRAVWSEIPNKMWQFNIEQRENQSVWEREIESSSWKKYFRFERKFAKMKWILCRMRPNKNDAHHDSSRT